MGAPKGNRNAEFCDVPTKFDSEKTIPAILHYVDNFDGPDYNDPMPNMGGLADALGVRRKTVYEWSKDDSKQLNGLSVGDALDRLRAKQEKILWQKGLPGDFNASLTKLALYNHGYSEKAVVTQESTLHVDAETKKQELLGVLAEHGIEPPEKYR